MPRPTCECGVCLKCRKRLAVRRFREKHPERWAQIQKRSNERNRDAINDRARRRWHETESPKIRSQRRRETVDEKQKASARWLLWRAVRDGSVVKGACEIGENCLGQIEAHHEDYEKPLEVRWLCRRHHMALHHRLRGIKPPSSA